MPETAHSAARFCEALLAGDETLLAGPVTVAPRDAAKSFPVKVLALAEGGAAGNPLIVTFHGPIDRKKTQAPCFDGAELVGVVGGSATIVALADPALADAPDLQFGWFLGSERLDLPAQIAVFLDDLVKAVAPSRLIFSGVSAGAHPALTHGYRFPESLCVLVNPLARVSDYNERAIGLYLDRCWPGQTQRQVIVTRRTDDAGSAYASGYANRVLVLQNATDHHFRGGVLSLLANLRGSARFALVSEFFPGYVGHSYPRAVLSRWIAAALAAPTLNFVDIATEFRSGRIRPAPAEAGATA